MNELFNMNMFFHVARRLINLISSQTYKEVGC